MNKLWIIYWKNYYTKIWKEITKWMKIKWADQREWTNNKELMKFLGNDTGTVEQAKRNNNWFGRDGGLVHGLRGSSIERDVRLFRRVEIVNARKRGIFDGIFPIQSLRARSTGRNGPTISRIVARRCPTKKEKLISDSAIN